MLPLAGGDLREKVTLIIALGWHSDLWEAIWQHLLKMKIKNTYICSTSGNRPHRNKKDS